jgi:hypothetical protein
MTQSDFYNLMMLSLQSAGFEVPWVRDYSPWRSQFWSPTIQTFLRRQLPEIAEQLIKRDQDIPETIQNAIANQNPYAREDWDLQRQCELFFPATCLRLQQAAIDQKRDRQLDAILTEKERKAHRIIAQRESTQLVYTYTKSGKKVRRSFLTHD